MRKLEEKIIWACIILVLVWFYFVWFHMGVL